MALKKGFSNEYLAYIFRHISNHYIFTSSGPKIGLDRLGPGRTRRITRTTVDNKDVGIVEM